MKIRYRTMRSGEEDAVAAVVDAAFTEFVAPGYTEKGVEEFRKYGCAESIRARTDGSPRHVVFVAEETGEDRLEIVGAAELRGTDHLSMLFVHPRWHRSGIGRRLFRRVLDEARAGDPGVREITVNSSPFAVPIYERLGFDVVGEAVDSNGVISIPMTYPVNTGSE